MGYQTERSYLLQVVNSGKLLVESELKFEGGHIKLEQETFEYKFSVDELVSVTLSYEIAEDEQYLEKLKEQAIQRKEADLLLLKEKLKQIEKDLQTAMKNKLATKIGEKILEKDETESEIETLENTKELSVTVELKSKAFTVTNAKPKVAVSLPVLGLTVFELITICEQEEILVNQKTIHFHPKETISPSPLLSLEYFRRLEEKAGFPEKLRNLLFRGTQDGFTAADVTRKTNGFSNSLVICKVEGSGRVFGGYTKVSLAPTETAGKYHADDSAFVFTITEENELRIFPVARIENAVHRYVGRGIDFGGGGTICLLQDGQGIRSGRCWSGEGVYTATDGLPFTTNTLAGSKDFKVQEVEVFGLLPHE